MEVEVPFTLIDWGRSPAQVFFPSLNPDPEGLLARQDRWLAQRRDLVQSELRGLPALSDDGAPGCRGSDVRDYRDVQWATLWRDLRHASLAWMADAAANRGWVSPREQRHTAERSPAQFVREYPMLERPEEMQAQADRLRLGHET